MTSNFSQQAAAAAAKRILGFYPEIPASDPKGFAAGLVQMLLNFPQQVIEQAADPAFGIPSRLQRLNLADLKKQLDAIAGEVHEQNVRRERARQRPLPRLEAPDAPPGAWANTFVPQTDPRYAKLCEWATTADPRRWKYGTSSDNRSGIWVARDVWEGNGQSRPQHQSAPDWKNLKLRPETLEATFPKMPQQDESDAA